MPEERLFTIRGRQPAALSHKKIQLSTHDPTQQYAIVEFQIMPSGTPVNSDCYGTLTMGKDDSINPSDPNFGNQNEIAWAHSSVYQRVPPGVAESVEFYNNEWLDIKLFAYDLWLHTEDQLGAKEVNWMIKIKRYKTTAESGSISSLRQFLANA